MLLRGFICLAKRSKRKDIFRVLGDIFSSASGVTVQKGSFNSAAVGAWTGAPELLWCVKTKRKARRVARHHELKEFLPGLLGEPAGTMLPSITGEMQASLVPNQLRIVKTIRHRKIPPKIAAQTLIDH